MNKRYIFLLGIIFLLVKGTQVQAQTDEFVYKSNALKISATAFFGSSFVLSYERMLKESISLQITAGLTAREKDSYRTNPTTNYYTNKDKVFGYSVEGAIRFYLSNDHCPLRGFYASPYGRFQNLDFNINTYAATTTGNSYTYQQIEYNLKMYEGGFLFGYQAVFSDKFLMDMYFGGCLKYSENTKPQWYGDRDYVFDVIEGYDYTGVAPRAGLRFGMKF